MESNQTQRSTLISPGIQRANPKIRSKDLNFIYSNQTKEKNKILEEQLQFDLKSHNKIRLNRSTIANANWNLQAEV